MRQDLLQIKTMVLILLIMEVIKLTLSMGNLLE